VAAGIYRIEKGGDEGCRQHRAQADNAGQRTPTLRRLVERRGKEPCNNNQNIAEEYPRPVFMESEFTFAPQSKKTALSIRRVARRALIVSKAVLGAPNLHPHAF